MDIAAAKLRRWREDPIYFARDCIGFEPDAWQADALRLLPSKGGVSRIALKACAGPGKTSVLGLAGWWFLSTQGEIGDHPKGLALSITKDNLEDNLWPELAKWRQRSPFIMAAFEQTGGAIFSRDHPDTWFLSPRSFARSADAKTQGSSLSGHHGKYLFYLLDESGDMLPSVGRSVEQGLAGAHVGMCLQAGNPTSLTGLLADSTQHSYSTITITADPDDPKRTPRVPAEWAREQIKIHGRDNPWVMSYILGLFPPGGLNTLLGLEDVQSAMRRVYQTGDFEHAPRVIGVDVAYMGEDSTVILRRQGLMSWAGVEMRSRDSMEVGDRVALEINEWEPDMVFIDGTGGWGRGVIDRLRRLGHDRRVMDVQFAGKPNSPKFLNKRIEMWWDMAQWIKQEGAVAQHDRMLQDLISPQYAMNDKGKMVLEAKEHIKQRGLPSPDFGDALALTFAQKVMPRELVFRRDLERVAMQNAGGRSSAKFDALSRVRHIGRR